MGAAKHCEALDGLYRECEHSIFVTVTSTFFQDLKVGSRVPRVAHLPGEVVTSQCDQAPVAVLARHLLTGSLPLPTFWALQRGNQCLECAQKERMGSAKTSPSICVHLNMEMSFWRQNCICDSFQFLCHLGCHIPSLRGDLVCAVFSCVQNNERAANAWDF